MYLKILLILLTIPSKPLSSFLQGPNEPNETLLKAINDEGTIHMVPSKVKDTYFLRLAICASRTTNSDIQLAWDVIKKLTDKMSIKK